MTQTVGTPGYISPVWQCSMPFVSLARSRSSPILVTAACSWN